MVTESVMGLLGGFEYALLEFWLSVIKSLFSYCGATDGRMAFTAKFTFFSWLWMKNFNDLLSSSMVTESVTGLLTGFNMLDKTMARERCRCLENQQLNSRISKKRNTKLEKKNHWQLVGIRRKINKAPL